VRPLGFACLTLLAACENEAPAPSARATDARPRKVEIVQAPVGEDAIATIQRESQRASAEGKKLVVYVGAPWCEPCVRFHDAAAAGKLDATFPSLRLLEFDRDRDETGLAKAGCITRLIPLFARPTSDGRCSDRRIEGSIKGEGAVAEITPRLAGILE